eukprot:COSAG01_NODE_2482_length_7600_cov_16.178110_4_plen_154_part_00
MATPRPDPTPNCLCLQGHEEVTFHEEGSLGLGLVKQKSLVDGQDYFVVRTITPGSVAEGKPDLRTGQILHTVQGETVENLTLPQVGLAAADPMPSLWCPSDDRCAHRAPALAACSGGTVLHCTFSSLPRQICRQIALTVWRARAGCLPVRAFS